MEKLEPGPLPLYYQLQQRLAEGIRKGALRPGDALPAEQQLGREYGVSRITVRRALEGLLAERLITRRRGVGTFVAGPHDAVKSVSLTGSLEVIAHTRDLRHKVLSREMVKPPSAVLRALGLPAGAHAVRLRTINYSGGEPFACAEFFFSEAVGALIRESDVTDNTPILRVVEQKLGLKIVRAEHTIEPDLADPTVAGHLGIKPRSAILKVLRIYYAAGDRPVQAAILRYHPERYRYTVRLHAESATV